MNIRKERTHGSGLTNLDFRTKGELNKMDYFNPSLKFSDFGTMTKTQYKRVPSAAGFKEQVALSGGWLSSKYKNNFYKDPRYESNAQSYQEKGKKLKVPVLISTVKDSELEAK